MGDTSVHPRTSTSPNTTLFVYSAKPVPVMVTGVPGIQPPDGGSTRVTVRGSWSTIHRDT